MNWYVTEQYFEFVNSESDSVFPPPPASFSLIKRDPIRAAIIYLLGETEANQRQSMTIDQVPQTVVGIQTLIEAGCLRAAVNLTHRLLSSYGQGYGRIGQPTRHTPHSLQLWFTRFALLVKLGEFDLCKREADAFGSLDRADMCYEVI